MKKRYPRYGAFSIISWIPWPVTALLALACYPLSRGLIKLTDQDVFMAAFGQGLASIWWVPAGLFGLLSLISLLRSILEAVERQRERDPE